MNLLILAFVPLLWACVRDLRAREIPDGASAALLALGAARVLLEGAGRLLPALAGLWLVGGVMLFCALCQDGVGGGDIKLCAGLGFLAGAQDAVLAVLAALCLLIIYGAARKKKSLPFAPFLLCGYTARLILMQVFGG